MIRAVNWEVAPHVLHQMYEPEKPCSGPFWVWDGMFVFKNRERAGLFQLFTIWLELHMQIAQINGNIACGSHTVALLVSGSSQQLIYKF